MNYTASEISYMIKTVMENIENPDVIRGLQIALEMIEARYVTMPDLKEND